MAALRNTHRLRLPRNADVRAQHRSFYPELVPVFMMIETDLFRRLNEKAARRQTSYGTMVREIVRQHISEYE